MEDFFTEFKKYILDIHKDDLKTFIGYYETLKQNEDQLSELLEDCSKHYFDIEYVDDVTQGYSHGTIIVFFYEENPETLESPWQSRLDFSYDIRLYYDERYWGYCQCQPQDAGYDPRHKCCGDGCDWEAPKIDVIKNKKIVYRSFIGTEKDMWILQDKWSGNEDKHKIEATMKEISYIEKQINELEQKKEALKNKL